MSNYGVEPPYPAMGVDDPIYDSHNIVKMAKHLAEIYETFLGADDLLTQQWRAAIDKSGMDKGEECFKLIRTQHPSIAVQFKSHLLFR